MILEGFLGVLLVTMSAYNADVAQTDSTPLITAYNTSVAECTVAVSRDLLRYLKKGTVLYIPGVPELKQRCNYLVRVNDKMHYRKRLQLDLFLWSNKEAKRFGLKKGIKIYITNCEVSGWIVTSKQWKQSLQKCKKN